MPSNPIFINIQDVDHRKVTKSAWKTAVEWIDIGIFSCYLNS